MNCSQRCIIIIFFQFTRIWTRMLNSQWSLWQCGNAQNSALWLLSQGDGNTISGLSGSCVSFLCSAGRSLGLPSSKQTPLLRPLQGESWGLLGYDQDEMCRKWVDAFMPLNAKLLKRLPCQCRVSSKSTELVIPSMTQNQHLPSLRVIPPYCFSSHSCNI